MRINIKPLSVNKCWQGKRFKTKDYKNYETEMMYQLRPLQIPSRIRLEIIVGFSNVMSDLDNILKPLLDIFQKKYGFNDRNIFELEIKKEKTNKNEEFIDFEIIEL